MSQLLTAWEGAAIYHISQLKRTGCYEHSVNLRAIVKTLFPRQVFTLFSPIFKTGLLYSIMCK